MPLHFWKLGYGTMVGMAALLLVAIVPRSQAEVGRSQPHPADPVRLALQPGEVSVSGESGQYVGQVLATGSMDAAWAALTDYNNFAAFFPDVETSQLLESNGNQKVFEQVNVVRVFPFTHRTRVVISATESYPQQIAFNVIDGDVESLQGVWQLEAVGTNQVLVTHRVAIDPGSSPTRDLFFNIYKNSLDDTMAALGQEITRRSGG